jgi:hypothetical protein
VAEAFVDPLGGVAIILRSVESLFHVCIKYLKGRFKTPKPLGKKFGMSANNPELYDMSFLSRVKKWV